MELSVVIPTYNRADILQKTITSLLKQTLSHFEIVIVDDGSTDGGATEKMIKKLITSNRKDINIQYIKQKNHGQGVARNNGIHHAHGEYILIIGDDIIPAHEHFLNAHLNAHKEESSDVAVLGYTEWDPSIEINDCMKFLSNGSCIVGKYGGNQFAYEKLNGDSEHRDSFGEKIKEHILLKGERLPSQHVRYATYDFFYTSNISIKKKWLIKEKFDESLKSYGWEDIEIGYRLCKKHNLKIRYQPNAKAYHHHEIHEKDIASKMINIGKSINAFAKIHPELSILPSRKKLLIFQLLSNNMILLLTSIAGKIWKKARNYYYYCLSKKYFLQGYHHDKKN